MRATIRSYGTADAYHRWRPFCVLIYTLGELARQVYKIRKHYLFGSFFGAVKLRQGPA